MPKRTNKFQTLVSLVEKSLLKKSAKVTESNFLKCSSGLLVEVDLTIESTSSGKYQCISVEASKKYPRKPDVGWVNEMYGKHSTLPTTKLVLVSDSNFTKGASLKAKMWGIETIAFSEALNLDWLPTPHKIPYINIESLLLPTLREIQLVFDESYASGIPKSNLQNLQIFDLNQTNHGNAFKIIAHDFLQNPKFINYIRGKLLTNETSLLDIEYPLKKGMHIVNDSGVSIPVHAIRAKAICRKDFSKTNLSKLAYGTEIGVTLAEGNTFQSPISILATQKKGEETILTIRVEKTINIPPK